MMMMMMMMMMSVMVSMVIRVTSITEAMIMMLIPMLMRNDVFKLFAIDVTNIVMFFGTLATLRTSSCHCMI